jgi:hypothetical protein
MDSKKIGNFLTVSGRGLAAVSAAMFVIGLALIIKERIYNNDYDVDEECLWDENNRCLECACGARDPPEMTTEF